MKYIKRGRKGRNFIPYKYSVVLSDIKNKKKVTHVYPVFNTVRRTKRGQATAPKDENRKRAVVKPKGIKRLHEGFAVTAAEYATKLARHVYHNKNIYKNIYQGLTGKVIPWDPAANDRLEALNSRAVVERIRNKAYKRMYDEL